MLMKELQRFRTKSGAPLVKAKNLPFYLHTVVMHFVEDEKGNTLITLSLFRSYL